jgi:hypothetical protein
MKSSQRDGRGEPGKTPKRQPLIFALEPRMMFDGAAVTTAAAAQAHVATDAHATATATHDTVAHEVAHQVPGADSGRDSSSIGAAERDSSATAESHASRNVLFVDARVEDSAELLAHVAPGTEVVYLQRGSDGLGQMRDYLAQHPGADSVQILAHGNQGDLWLGSTYLSADDIGAHANELAQIGANIKSGGDILIYACETAEADKGLSFVTSFAQLTQRDVAASSNRTGAGSDWNLEITTGRIEAAPVLAAADEAGYTHDLALLTVTSNADSGAGSLRAAITSATSGDTITFNAGMTISLTSGELAISKNLTIDGDLDNNGTADVTIDAGYHSRVLHITAGTVTLDGLTIQHGLLSGAGANKGQSGGSSFGAGISNAGTLTLLDVTVSHNYATGGGGAVPAGAYAGGGGGGGSGVAGIGGAAGGYTIGSSTYSGQPGGGGSGETEARTTAPPWSATAARAGSPARAALVAPAPATVTAARAVPRRWAASLSVAVAAARAGTVRAARAAMPRVASITPARCSCSARLRLRATPLRAAVAAADRREAPAVSRQAASGIPRPGNSTWCPQRIPG